MSELTIWQELKSCGLNDYAVAGIMGNIEAESAMRSNNVEDRCPMSDADYTRNVDTGITPLSTFIHDAYGYGLCQWTFYSRKQGLYDMCKRFNVSISDEETQLQFLMKELKTQYVSCYNKLLVATSVQAASDAFLLEFENPANAQGQRAYRASLGQKWYDKYKGTASNLYRPETPTTPIVPTPTIPSVPTVQTPTATQKTGQIHVVRYGDRTWYGNAIQSLLKAHGYNIAVDMDVRDGTMNALKQFAQQRNLDPEKDFIQIVYELFTE